MSDGLFRLESEESRVMRRIFVMGDEGERTGCKIIATSSSGKQCFPRKNRLLLLFF